MVMDELRDPQDLESTGPATTKSPPSCKAASRTQSSNLSQKNTSLFFDEFKELTQGLGKNYQIVTNKKEFAK